ncbi:MAG TPA: AraC family transcriptional regulator [Pyrinomonadaceae bacterium]|jgi:AraC-like DNA-binding protein
MKVKTFTPQNPLLRKYIECFYTLTRKREEKDDVYLAFPNVFSILCLHRQTKIELIENVRTLSHRPGNEFVSNLICHIKRSEQIRYQGEADEICVYFKPLGINAFLDKELRQYVRAAVAEFNPFEDYRLKMTEIFSFENVEDRIRALENYWLSKHVGFRHAFLPQTVEEIMENDRQFSLSGAARKIGISRTTLVKHFDLHLCTTPSHFKKIARFRSAMKQHGFKFSGANLTALSHSAEYFDQSHMIKDFKSLTSFAPKPFFSNISSLENGRINWMFL